MEKSRRVFIKQLAILGIGSQFFMYACNDKKMVVIPSSYTPMSEVQAKIIAYILEILFPNEGNAPSIQQLNTLEYVIWNLNDKKRDPESNEYIINGIDWVEETAIEEKQKTFLELKDKDKTFIIEFISKKSWGEGWLSTILTLIFESLVYDPIYNINKEQVGWNWLKHKPGYPRPTEKIKYKAS